MEYGLIGETLKHSFSAEIHPQFFGYRYELCEVRRDNLSRFMKNKNFKGINVTIPYKKEVMQYLDYIDPIAEKIGAVNTVVNESGKLSGYNTDYYGLKSLIERNVDIADKRVVILGTGGTSNTAKFVSESLGCKECLTVSREAGRGDITYEQLYEEHTDTEVIINATPSGMYPDIDSAPVDVTKFKNLICVIDAVYNPLNTKLVYTARKNGIKAECGLYMLVCQAAYSAELFTGKRLGKQKVQTVYENLYKSKQNIVLIGMPTSGKTTVAKEISKLLNREWYDTDNLITRYEKTDIKTIFENKGEEYFRNVESEAVKFVSAKSGVVIATGGGVILNEKNIDFLKQNGVVYFLDRPLKSLFAAGDRPLSSTRENLEKIYNERYEIYKAFADKTVKAIGDASVLAKTVTEDFRK